MSEALWIFNLSGAFDLVRQPTVQVEVSHTVGAEGAFTAAALSCLPSPKLLDRIRQASLSGEELEARPAYNSQAAVVNFSRVGADPAFKHKFELHELNASERA